ncbi:MAG: iron ABC transporter permease [Deferribacteraceae bacterium]|nr:iron ABC transporter permease [Deferribacteraceae bacterium]
MKYILLSVLLILSITAGIYAGQVELFPLNEFTRDILWDFRIPRVIFAALNGATLALAGMLYQITLRNPMAEGFTTGAASSAAFGGCLALALSGRPWTVSLCAVISAFAGIAIVRYMAKHSGGFNPVTVILAGIAVSVMAGSGVSFLKYYFEESVSTLVFWLMGGLTRASWVKTAFMAALLVIVMNGLAVKRRKIAVLFLDDHSAITSGVNVPAMREFLFIVTTALVAFSVSFCGIISFIGLMIPHAVRALFGHDINTQLFCTPLAGAFALTVFDLLSRVILPSGSELPVGILTALCGGLFFSLLLMKKGGKVWNS